MQNKEVLIAYPSDGVVHVQINRPEVRNALSQQVRQALAQYFIQFSSDETVRCIVLSGSATVFAAGADIRDMAQATPIDMMLRNTQKLWQSIADCPKPVVAAVNGLALGGGCELAMLADIIIAGEGARFGQPEVRLGIIPGAGGTQRLTRAVGKYKAMKIVLTGEMLNATEAYTMGLVSEVVADESVLEHAFSMAKHIASLPPLAIMQIKEVVLAGMDASLDTALSLERKAFQLLFSSEDQKEGMQAFLNKQVPTYKGR